MNTRSHFKNIHLLCYFSVCRAHIALLCSARRTQNAFIAFFGVLLLSVGVQAQSPSQESVGINSSYLNRTLSKVTLKGLKNVPLTQIPPLLTRKGFKPVYADIQSDINSLYLTGLFQKVEFKPIPTANVILAMFKVVENPVVEHIRFEGVTVFSETFLKTLFLTQEGRVFNFNHFVTDKRALEQLYRDKGYPLAKVVGSVFLPSTNVLVITVAQGQLSQINVKGLKNIKPFVLTREMKTKVGDVYNEKQIRDDRERILRLGYFSDISSPFLGEGKKHEIVLTWNAVERKNNLINLGLEQDRERLVGFAEWTTHHTLLHSDLLSTKFQISRESSNQFQLSGYSVRYGQPWLLNQWPVSMVMDVWSEYRKEYLIQSITEKNVTDNRRIGASVTLGYPLDDTTLLKSRFKYESIQPRYSGSQAFEAYSVRSFLLGLSSTNVYPSLTGPHSGYYWSIEAEKGGNLGFVDLKGLEFSRANLAVAGFLPITEQSTLGVGHVLGIFKSVPDTAVTFESEGYVLGGAGSLRGYKETSPYVGTRKALFHVEYRYTLNSSLDFVTFVDTGTVFKTGTDFYKFSDYLVGKGVGFRVSTPLGPLRTDFAWGEAFIIHLGLGQVF